MVSLALIGVVQKVPRVEVPKAAVRICVFFSGMPHALCARANVRVCVSVRHTCLVLSCMCCVSERQQSCAPKSPLG